MKQNITLRLDRDLIRKAKVVAASRETSVSQLLSDKLEEIVRQGEAYERGKRAALADLDQGFHLGGKRRVTRDQLHER
jgi:predicted transcriptional regulator